MQSGQGDPGAVAYGDVKRLERRVAALEQGEERQQWLDTYNAALTGLLMGSDCTDRLHELASRVADRLHGEQS